MHTVKLTLATLLLVGFGATACQRADDDELADAGDAVIAVPDTAQVADLRDTPEPEVVVTPESDRPEREIVVVREPAPAAEPRRVAPRPAPRRRAEIDEPREASPRAEAPRPAPRPSRVTIPSGTNFFVTTETALSTRDNQVGDPLAARTSENINVNGQVVVPAGALVEGHVTSIKSAGNPGEVAYIDVAFDRIRLANGEWLPISAVLAGKAGEEVKGSSNTPRNVAIGAGAGAVLGRVIGGDAKSTVIGAVIGAGAGAAASQATRDTYIVVPSGSRINVQLTSSASVPVS